jgi:CheY-like chemotaxis protein
MIKVLIADDQWHYARALEAELADEPDLEILEVVHTAEDAVAAAARLGPDVVLLDLDLPKLDGYGVAVAIRRDPQLRACCLIAVSGFGDDGARKRSRASGIDHHMVKPVDFEGLVRYLDGRS